MKTTETDDLDPFVDRASAADVITERYFPCSPRALRTWRDPATIVLQGRACARRSQWLRAAEKRLNEALFRGDSTTGGAGGRNTAAARTALARGRDLVA